jgi:hypothetical protein
LWRVSLLGVKLRKMHSQKLKRLAMRLYLFATLKGSHYEIQKKDNLFFGFTQDGRSPLQNLFLLRAGDD